MSASPRRVASASRASSSWRCCMRRPTSAGSFSASVFQSTLAQRSTKAWWKAWPFLRHQSAACSTVALARCATRIASSRSSVATRVFSATKSRRCCSYLRSTGRSSAGTLAQAGLSSSAQKSGRLPLPPSLASPASEGSEGKSFAFALCRRIPARVGPAKPKAKQGQGRDPATGLTRQARLPPQDRPPPLRSAGWRRADRQRRQQCCQLRRPYRLSFR